MAESLLEMVLSQHARVVYGTEVDLVGWVETTEEEFNFFLCSHPPKDSLILNRSSFYEFPTLNSRKILVGHKTYSFCECSILIKSLFLSSADNPRECAYFIKYCS